MNERTVLDRPVKAEYQLAGCVGEYLRNVTERWVKAAPLSNPGMLQMFRDRDRKPLRNMVPWAGEFAGKYLTGAVLVLRTRPDKELKAFLGEFVKELIACQADDGYLGPWPAGSRLANRAPNFVSGFTPLRWPWPQFGHYVVRPGGKVGGGTWDTWGHYHVMLGLMLWSDTTGDRKALAACRKIGDLLCSRFLGRKNRLVGSGSTEMNLAPVHALAMLHRRTGVRRYLDLALQIVGEFSTEGPDGPLAGDYLRAALAGKEFFQMPKPRWESLHPIMGLAELYWITGEDRYRRAYEHIYWSILKGDRHNNGGFSSGEKATGNPYHRGAIETCCTIAWIAMGVEMLRMGGSSVVADELELSTLNSVVGMHSASGRWVTYDTPMDGIRAASAHQIVFQAREGTPELNCCSVNGHRGLGMISDWALMRHADGGLVLNYYGPSEMTAQVGSSTGVRLIQKTDYPRGGAIRLAVRPSRPSEFALRLRIPYWSHKTAVSVNGRKVEDVAPGSYCAVRRKWKTGDVVDVRLDMSLHFWAGRRQCRGRTSVYRGPILLTYDRRFNDVDPDDLPAMDAASLKARPVLWKGPLPPALLLACRDAKGKGLRLCDFGSAGEGGTPYVSWLKITNPPRAAFSRTNPLRSARPAMRTSRPSG